MRPLTIGVIIVTVGTLAALPFRRHRPPAEASRQPAYATGPAHSSLVAAPARWEFPPEGPVAAEAGGSAPVNRRSSAVREDSRRPGGSGQGTSAGESRQRLAAQAEAARPLTYEDFAISVAPSRILRERFSATVPAAQTDAARPGTQTERSTGPGAADGYPAPATLLNSGARPPASMSSPSVVAGMPPGGRQPLKVEVQKEAGDLLGDVAAGSPLPSGAPRQAEAFSAERSPVATPDSPDAWTSPASHRWRDDSGEETTADAGLVPHLSPSPSSPSPMPSFSPGSFGEANQAPPRPRYWIRQPR